MRLRKTTRERINSLRLLASSLALLLLVSCAGDRRAPHAAAGPVDQLAVAGNACGPAALLAALRSGDEATRRVLVDIPASTERGQLLHIIRVYGLRPSKSLRNRKRWSTRGINPEDLQLVSAELMARGNQRPPVTRSLLAPRGASGRQILREVHRKWWVSLDRGFPPVVALTRYARRKGEWIGLASHFVTIVEVPGRLGHGADGFDFLCFDPWMGREYRARLGLPSAPFLEAGGGLPGTLSFEAPAADVGKGQVRAGEISLITPTIMIGY